MTSAILSLRLLILLGLLLGLAPTADAQETLYWVSGGTNNFAYVDNALTDTSNIQCGNGSATVTFTNPNAIAQAPFPDAITQAISGQPGGVTQITMDATNTTAQRTTMRIVFSVPVDNLQFSIFDIDSNGFVDGIDVAALDGVTGRNVGLACANAPTACVFTITNNNTPTATATGTAASGAGVDYLLNARANVTITGPVRTVTVTFRASTNAALLALQGISFGGFTLNCTTVPVTVSSFRAQPNGDGVQFDWTTATETSNVGFYLYGDVDGSWQRLHSQLIPSPRIDSLVPQTYSQTIRGVTAKQFSLAEVDIRGNEFLHGPYQLAQSYGQTVTPEPIDWRSVHLESDTTAPRGTPERLVRALHAASPPVYELGVDVTGLYRVTYEDLLAAGLDLNGVPTAQLALTNQSKPVARRVVAGQKPRLFGPGGFIEFFGQGLDTLYTTTNIYRLTIDPTNALPVSEVKESPSGVAPTSYAHTVTIEENKEYSFSAPNGDPWYDSPILAFTSPAAKTFAIPVDHLAPTGDATLHVSLWGVTDWPGDTPDHHVVVALNGSVVADRTFDGLVDASMKIPLAAGLVLEGANTLTITVGGDAGFEFDLVHIDSYGLTYPRSFAALNDRLTFAGTAKRFEVSQLTSPKVVVYRMAEQTLTRLVKVSTVPDGNGAFRTLFTGRPGQRTTYLVSTVAALRKPTLAPARPRTNLLVGPARYLIIADPHFLDGLSELVSARQAQGFTVKVVNVNDVYAQYSGGVFDPTALRRYLRAARQRLGVTHVLLVGGDTYDYHDYLGVGSISFIPSLYTQTDDIVHFTPSDALLADGNGDQVPDLAIGRFPVRTQQELATMIQKTLVYSAQGKQAVFAADERDGSTSFTQLSDEMLATLPKPWAVQAQTAYIDQLGLSGARTRLLSAMNQGVALTNYVGHSGPTIWSFTRLFSAQDAVALTNNAPTLSLQWGCWNAYHSMPQYNSLSHKLLLTGAQGAAAVVGASTLTTVASDQSISLRVLTNLMRPGQTLGQAILTAKRGLVAAEGNRKDVVLGLTLLGDPALVVAP